jgi:hypothetical protein
LNGGIEGVLDITLYYINDSVLSILLSMALSPARDGWKGSKGRGISKYITRNNATLTNNKISPIREKKDK